MPRRSARHSDPVFAAIEMHRVALSEFSAEAAYCEKKRGAKAEEAYRIAREAYDASTVVLTQAEITSLAGLRAFVDHFAALNAYGPSPIAPGTYTVEIWHLSDAMETVAEALLCLSRPRALSWPEPSQISQLSHRTPADLRLKPSQDSQISQRLPPETGGQTLAGLATLAGGTCRSERQTLAVLAISSGHT